MTWTSIVKLKVLIEQIRHYLVDNKVIRLLIDEAKKRGDSRVMEIINHDTDTRLFYYKSVIISIYGAFEQYIEGLLSEYIQKLCILVPNFSKFNDCIKRNYVDNWKKLHSKLAYPKYNFLSEQEIVQNLYDVINNDKNTLIPECYFSNNGNYRCSVVNAVFSQVGIDMQMLDKYYLSEGSEITFKNVTGIIDDLVERRNDIAHGQDNLQLLDTDMLIEMVDCVNFYAETLLKFLEDNLLTLLWENMIKNKEPISAIHTFPQKQVLEFKNVTNTNIAVGMSTLVCLPPTHYPKYVLTSISSLRAKENPGDIIVERKELFQTKSYNGVSICITDTKALNNKAKVICFSRNEFHSFLK